VYLFDLQACWDLNSNAQTSYGVTTFQALCGNFARVRLISFCRNWFADAQQETFLLLAEGRGGRCGCTELIPLNTIQELSTCVLNETDSGFEIRPDPNMLLGLGYLSTEARAVWQEVSETVGVGSLHQLGDVANGYV
jgi:adenine-specific DNA-methyltransferase